MKSGSPSRTTAAHKTQTKIQAWSSLVFHCRHSSFNPSEAPPWDSRPVSGAGVVHYRLLHRPRSVPTALGPAPLATVIHRPVWPLGKLKRIQQGSSDVLQVGQDQSLKWLHDHRRESDRSAVGMARYHNFGFGTIPEFNTWYRYHRWQITSLKR